MATFRITLLLWKIQGKQSFCPKDLYCRKLAGSIENDDTRERSYDRSLCPKS